VVVDSKGDALVRAELEAAARMTRRQFRLSTPERPAVYNPFAHGTETSRSGARIPRPAARTRRRLHRELICDPCDGGRLSADGESSWRTGGSSPRPGRRPDA